MLKKKTYRTRINPDSSETTFDSLLEIMLGHYYVVEVFGKVFQS